MVSLAPDSFAFKYALSAAAAAVAETVTFPLDITKTRMQVQGERGTPLGGAPAPGRRSMLRTAAHLVEHEGVLALWRGLTPAVLRHVVYSGVRMGVYEKIRAPLLRWQGGGEGARLSLPLAVAAGMSSGAIGQFLASPTDLVKVQMQMEGRRRLEGLPPRYRGVADAFATILRQGGVRGLWKGWVPNVQRAALVNLGDLTAYDTAKQLLLRHTSLGDTSATHALASLAAGLVAATFGTPADVIKTRVMNQPTDAQGRGTLYRGSVDCLRRTLANEGVGALYKGFVPIWLRMAPWSLTFWLSYEQMRRLAGARSF